MDKASLPPHTKTHMESERLVSRTDPRFVTTSVGGTGSIRSGDAPACNQRQHADHPGQKHPTKSTRIRDHEVAPPAGLHRRSAGPGAGDFLDAHVAGKQHSIHALRENKYACTTRTQVYMYHGISSGETRPARTRHRQMDTGRSRGSS
jgi:hypothetical protein